MVVHYFLRQGSHVFTELSVDRVDPRVGSDRVGSNLFVAVYFTMPW